MRMRIVTITGEGADTGAEETTEEEIGKKEITDHTDEADETGVIEIVMKK
jgi:hypothetical protein